MIRNYNPLTTRFNPQDCEEDYVTIEEAGSILGLQRSQTRVLLGEPDKVWQSAVGQLQYVFLRERVEKIRKIRDERRLKRELEHGLRSCYYCKEKFAKKALTGGICPSCQAKKIVKNFACNGDCIHNCFDIGRLKLLAEAITNICNENFFKK